MRLLKRIYILSFFILSVSVFYGTANLAEAHEGGYADLIERLMPSVVNIRTIKEVTVAQQPSFRGFRFPPNSPFHELFKNFPNPNIPEETQPEEKRQATSLGSGFVLKSSGIVVTNNHVIDGADAIFVELQSGDSFPAELIGTDQRTDLAVLRILNTTQAFQAVSFGDSDTMRVGDAVLAIGNPLGLGGTVTTGIISARGRDINAGPYDDFIQTDASINRGNSGGPLFNDKGEVIGINTAIFSQSGGSIGIGFAIPAAQASRVVAQLTEFGTTKRGWLGVNIQAVDDEIAKTLGLPKTFGALVTSAYEDSPAEGGDIRAGDVIIYFDGKEVESSRKLPFMVAATDVNKEVEVIVWRDGNEVTLSVRLGELEKFDQQLAQQQEGAQEIPETSKKITEQVFPELGLGVASAKRLPKALLDSLGVSADNGGLVVLRVTEGSSAETVGIKKGMQILQAGQVLLQSEKDLALAIKNVKANGLENILLLVQVKDTRRFVTLKLAK